MLAALIRTHYLSFAPFAHSPHASSFSTSQKAAADAALAAAKQAEIDRLAAEKLAREAAAAAAADREALMAESAKIVADLTNRLADAEARASLIAPRLKELLEKHAVKPVAQSQVRMRHGWVDW